jgi:hypothetical protein
VSKSSNAFGNVHPSLPSNAISRSKKVSRFFSILCNARENFREVISLFDINTTPVLLFSSLLFSCSRQFRIKRGVQFLVFNVFSRRATDCLKKMTKKAV